MGLGDFLNWLFGDYDESKRQYQKDINDIMHIAYDPEESAMYDEFDEYGQVPHTHPGDEEEGPITPPRLDPDDHDDDSGGGSWLDWLLGRR